MKNFLLIALLALWMNAGAQITLEHFYNNNKSTFTVVRLSATNYKWAEIDSSTIKLYNANHSLYQTISIVNAPVSPWDVLFISATLFDTDSTTIEYMVDYSDGSMKGSGVNIYRDNGAILFSEQSSSAFFGCFAMTDPVRPLWYPILATNTGTKMVLVAGYDSLTYIPNAFKVYSLPGVYYPNTTPNISQIDNQMGLSNPYPNPSIISAQIDYTLPDGVDRGEIVFYDLTGNEVKRFTVDKTFNTLFVSTSDITAGTYYYQLQTTRQSSEGKKMLVIK